MREWHVKHMEQTLVKFITGLSEDASRWQMKLNKKYGTIGRVSKRIEYDIKHGVTKGQVILIFAINKNRVLFLRG